MRFTPVRALWLALVACMAVGVEAETEISKPTFSIFNESGYIVKAHDNIVEIGDQFITRNGISANFSATRDNGLRLDLSIGGVYWNPTVASNADPNYFFRFFSPSLSKFDVSYGFGDKQKPFLTVDAGLFPYKYNEYAHDLGEYLFRSNAYPGIIYTGGLTYVDVNSATVTGVKLSQSLNRYFSHDLLVTLETETNPVWDINLTYLAKLNVKDVFKLTGGVEFARAIPVRPSLTNPKLPQNAYFKHNGKSYIDDPYYYQQRRTGELRRDTAADVSSYDAALAVLDSVSSGQIAVDLSYYEASAIKPVATFSFDPKPLLGMGVFGKNDLVLYGEAAILGVKDQPVLYDDIWKRMPVMLGFNVPTFKLLDVLTIEVEHYGSQFPNSNFKLQTEFVSRGGDHGGNAYPPIPVIPISAPGKGSDLGYVPSEWDADNWKWAVFAKRRLTDGLFASLQVASDNGRGWVYPQGRQYYSIFLGPSEWYWMGRITANF